MPDIYLAGIGVHYTVGYNDMHHLLPAFAGLSFFLLGLVLSRDELCYREKIAGPV